jgi:hypothetical protein
LIHASAPVTKSYSTCLLLLLLLHFYFYEEL